MTNVPASPYAIQSATLKLGTDTFHNAVQVADCQPSYSGATFDTIDGDSHPVVDQAAWVLALTYAQDLKNTASLANYLAEHDGEIVPFEYQQDDDATIKVTGSVLVRAGNIGGTSKQVAQSSVNLPVKGQPTLAAVGA